MPNYFGNNVWLLEFFIISLERKMTFVPCQPPLLCPNTERNLRNSLMETKKQEQKLRRKIDAKNYASIFDQKEELLNIQY